MTFYAHATDGELRCRLCGVPQGTGHLSTCPLLGLRSRVQEVVSTLGLYVADAREQLDDLDRLLRGDEVAS